MIMKCWDVFVHIRGIDYTFKIELKLVLNTSICVVTVPSGKDIEL